MVYRRSVTVKRHRHNENLKGTVTNQLTGEAWKLQPCTLYMFILDGGRLHYIHYTYIIFPRNLAMHSDGEDDDEDDYWSDDDWRRASAENLTMTCINLLFTFVNAVTRFFCFINIGILPIIELWFPFMITDLVRFINSYRPAEREVART